MCGIAGIVHRSDRPVSAVLLKSMTDALEHRGPDGSGSFIEGRVGLGHRRLSIIDLSPAGRQPMLSNNRRYVISYNGEVYNFKELRTELQSLGHKFYSDTDSEVVLEAFSEWGTDCLTRLNGMFAFAIWDLVEHSLFLARDRYGIKPLYYADQGSQFLFASEVKAILTHPEVKREMNLEALMEYLTFQNIFTDRTLLKGIKLLAAGSYLKFRPYQDKEPSVHRYWDFSFVEPENAQSEADYIEELNSLFVRAVNRQLVSDVDVGAYLSGGMDSGSITALAASQIPYMKSFTIGFDLNSASGIELNFDEREKAEHISYLFKTEHYEMVLKSGDMERIMMPLIWHLEEPRVGQSYPNFYSAQLASKFVKVCLAGTGGDELFGGYPWRYYRAVVNNDFEDYIDKYYKYWQRLIPNKELHQIFQPVWSDVKHVWTRDIFRDVFQKHAHTLTRPEDYINHSLYFEAKTFLHGLLMVEDKLSMAHSLETRVPFLDNDLVDFAMRLPASMKLSNLGEVVRVNENQVGTKKQYFEKTKDGKRILRKVMENYIPKNITQRIKQGFSAPDASWFRGESLEFVKRELLTDSAPIYRYLDKKSIQGMINDHLSGQRNARLAIWSFLSLNAWIPQFIDQPHMQRARLAS